MAWENVITGYRIKKFYEDDIIPLGAIFLDRYFRTRYEITTEIFVYQIPIYKKKNIKKS